MGKSVIDRWLQNTVGKSFKWGELDCHTITIQYIKLKNIDNPVKSPKLYTVLNRKYTNWREANEVAKTVYMDTWLKELGYNPRPVNRLQEGDIIKLESKTRSYDQYAPVVFGETILLADLKSRRIRLASGYNISDYEVYRR